jgi:hypothetical protein
LHLHELLSGFYYLKTEVDVVRDWFLVVALRSILAVCH